MSSPNRKKVQKNYNIEMRQYEALHRLSRKRGIPVAKLIREGIDMVLKNYEESSK